MQDQSFLFAALQRGLSVSSRSVWEECGHMTSCGSCRRIGTILVVVMSLLSLLAAQEKKEFHYTVGPRAMVSITNNYGPVTVMPS
jgi:hypothetical protein